MGKKEEELHFVRLLGKFLGAFPLEGLSQSEEPDALVQVEQGILGIEVTQVHQSGRPGEVGTRHQEGERAAIVAEARRLAEQSDIPPLSVSVHFSAHTVSKLQRKELAERLASAVAGNIPSIDREVFEIDNRFGNALSEVFRTVRIYRSPNLTRHHWSVPDSGWVQTELIDELQSAIATKGRRFEQYVQNCDLCWLLIVASGHRPSSLFDPSEETRSHTYESRFGRTFFLEAFSGQVVELRTRLPGAV